MWHKTTFFECFNLLLAVFRLQKEVFENSFSRNDQNVPILNLFDPKVPKTHLMTPKKRPQPPKLVHIELQLAV